jgi:hypothetical protein
MSITFLVPQQGIEPCSPVYHTGVITIILLGLNLVRAVGLEPTLHWNKILSLARITNFATPAYAASLIFSS